MIMGRNQRPRKDHSMGDAANARKRLNRFLASPENQDKLLSLSRDAQTRVLNDAYQQGSRAAQKTLDREYTKVHVARSAASSKAAATRLRRRKKAVVDSILRALSASGAQSPPRKTTIMRGVSLMSISDLRKTEKRSGDSLASFVKDRASQKVSSGVVNPFWYR